MKSAWEQWGDANLAYVLSAYHNSSKSVTLERECLQYILNLMIVQLSDILVFTRISLGPLKDVFLWKRLKVNGTCYL